MKRVFATLLACLFCLSCAAAEGGSFDDMSLDEVIALRDAADREILARQEDPLVERAIEALLAHWKNDILEHDFGGGYVAIRWTRVVYLTEEAAAMPQFENMVAFVEFFLLSDYFETAPYYMHAGVNECVAFYRDGSCEVLGMNPINRYRSATFSNDFSFIIASASDRSGDFNGEYDVLAK